MSTESLKSRASVPNSQVLIAFAIGTLLAGANAVAVRFTVAELAPFWGAGMRFALASSLLWLLVVLRPRGRLSAHDLWAYVLYGAVGFGLAYALLYWGLKFVPAGMAQVILALTPLLTFFFAIAHRQERFRWRGLLGAVIAMAGIAFAFLEGGLAAVPFLPILAMVGGAACFAESSILVKRVSEPDPLMANAVGMTTGSAMLLIASAIIKEPWALPHLLPTWLSVGYLAIVGSVIVFSLSVFVLGHWTASASAYQLVLMPFVTVGLASWLAHESFGPGLLVGGALVLIGVWVGALSSHRAKPTRETVIAAPVSADAD